MSGEATKTRKWFKRLAIIGLALLCIAASETALHTVGGWFFHSQNNLPLLLAKWPAMILPLICLLISAFLAHRFIRWWLLQKQSSVSWKPAHTISIISILLMISGAAIAMSGIVHQAAWLSGEPWYADRNRNDDPLNTSMNARILAFALVDFQAERDRSPLSFEELREHIKKSETLSDKDALLKSCVAEIGTHKLPEPFILLKPGKTFSGDANGVVFVSPVVSGDQFCVGLENGDVRWFDARALDQVLKGNLSPESTHEFQR